MTYDANEVAKYEQDDSKNFYDFAAVDIDFNIIKRFGDSICKGAKATLVVNITDNCVLTKRNLAELEELYQEYHSDGL